MDFINGGAAAGGMRPGTDGAARLFPGRREWGGAEAYAAGGDVR